MAAPSSPPSPATPSSGTPSSTPPGSARVASKKAKAGSPLVAGILAGLLVFLVLPNPLKVPQQNPTATAEYAPVPGNSDDAAENANFGETGLAGSPGIGAGGSGAGQLPGIFTPPPPVFKPRQKLCVGSPPRQTEDPLSPPCVPFFEGDNGGATFQGVTDKEIKVVLYNDLGIEGDMNQPWEPEDDNHGTGTGYENINLVRTVKAQLRYFQQRYQTYGRTVHMIALPSTGSSCPQQAGDAALTKADHRPFAAVVFGDGKPCYQEKLAHDYGTPSFGLSFDVKHKFYQDNAPYIWGFMPDQETMQEWSAAFVCTKLWQNGAGTAKFTDDDEVKGKKRKFAFVYGTQHHRGPAMQEEADLMLKFLKERCGLVAGDNMYVDTYQAQSPTAPAGAREAPGYMQKYKTNNVTTMICYCLPVQTELTVTQFQNAANTLEYHPEWYWDDVSAMDRGIWQSTFGSREQKSLGTSYLWRAGAFSTQYAYQAYQSVEPGSAPNSRFNFNIYHLMLNLFEGIQAAGPKLTPESVEQGMYTFTYVHPENPYVPSGGYGPYGPRATSDQTFIDTAMGWWWDPDGTPPGGQRNSGCIRPIHGGKRFFADQWPAGDDDLFKKETAPCSQDLQKLADPGRATST
jgi:hypothetical protein